MKDTGRLVVIVNDMGRLVKSLDLKSEVDVDVKPPKYEPYICTRDESP